MAEGYELDRFDEHTHDAIVHSHGHFHVTHNHNRMAGGFDHLSSYHEHEHDHAQLNHRHYPHEDFDREHEGEAHVHDHAAPVKNGKARKAASKSTKKSAVVSEGDGTQ